jgi:hypothetical protein
VFRARLQTRTVETRAWSSSMAVTSEMAEREARHRTIEQTEERTLRAIGTELCDTPAPPSITLRKRVRFTSDTPQQADSQAKLSELSEQVERHASSCVAVASAAPMDDDGPIDHQHRDTAVLKALPKLR